MKKSLRLINNVIMCKFTTTVIQSSLFVENNLCRNKLRTPKKTSMGNTSLDQYLLGSLTPVNQSAKNSACVVRSSAPPLKRLTSHIEFSLDVLSLSLKSCPHPPKDQWVCLKKFEKNCWLCSNGEEIMAVNFTRLYEIILYSQLANSHVLQSRPTNSPILIDKKLG